jgi:hypothetical protein
VAVPTRLLVPFAGQRSRRVVSTSQGVAWERRQHQITRLGNARIDHSGRKPTFGNVVTEVLLDDRSLSCLSHDFFESRVSSDLVPYRIETQFSIAWAPWQPHDCRQLAKRRVVFTAPDVNLRERRRVRWSIHRIAGHGNKLNSLSAFAQGVALAAESSIRQTKIAQ